MKSLIKIFLFFIVLCEPFNPSFAQEIFQRIEIPSSANPVGSGARALGMGGAFIAVADDATAASWNPGGLIQLERPEVSVVGAYVHRIEENTFGTNSEASGNQAVDESRLNYLSAVYPFNLRGLNMIVSLNYQHLYDFNRQWDYSRNVSSGQLLSTDSILYDLSGSLSAFGLAYCAQITPRISIGLTLNFWEDGLYENEWEEKRNQSGDGIFNGFPVNYSFQSVDKYSFSGFNANLGILWSLNEKITLGAVFKTPFEAELTHEHKSSSTTVYPTTQASNTSSSTFSVTEETIEMPMSYGFGLAYRFCDAFTVSADIYRTQWDDYALTDSNGNTTSPITGLSPGASGISPTTQVRIGAEYLFVGSKYVVPLRGGVFYDPAPAKDNPDDYYGFSLGSGIVVRRFVFDIAYQYRFGSDVGGSVLKNADFSQDLDEHTVYASLIIHL